MLVRERPRRTESAALPPLVDNRQMELPPTGAARARWKLRVRVATGGSEFQAFL